MPSIVCRQPNGKLALYSTIADGFTVWDATEEEMLHVLRQRGVGRLEREELVARGLDDADSALGKPFSPNTPEGLTRWVSALESMRIYNDDEAVDKMVVATGGADVLPLGFWDAHRQAIAEDRARDEARLAAEERTRAEAGGGE